MTPPPDLRHDAVALTQRLVAFDTINPPGNESTCAAFVQQLLEAAGFTVEAFAHARGRTNLVARAGGGQAKRALCFVGHLDTVPLGKAAWQQDPFAGRIVDGRLYGRGATDMKSGVAAFIVAAASRARSLPKHTELVLLLVAGEETGCEGSSYLAGLGLPLGHFDGVVVAEPTVNHPLLGHKGALWLKAATQGVAAHGAMPEQGVNAVRKAAEIVRRLEGFCSARGAHPVLGEPTLNIGTFHGGEIVNAVPDWAEVGLDIRTVSGMDHGQLQQELREILAPELHELSVIVSMEDVYTPLDDPWVKRVFAIVERENGSQPQARTASYFTDASALKPVLGGAPLLILGPGEPSVMHQTDEYCEVDRIHEAVRIYTAIIDATLHTGEGATGAEALAAVTQEPA
jgi:succinyl-diaminopimelate desuccinylase